MKTIPLLLLPDALSDKEYETLYLCSYSSDYPSEPGFTFLILRELLIEALENNPECTAFVEELKKLNAKVVAVAPNLLEYKSF